MTKKLNNTTEDFGFCKRWTAMGGKIHLWCMDFISHTGEFEYCGRYWDELVASKQAIEAREKGVDEPKKSHKITDYRILSLPITI